MEDIPSLQKDRAASTKVFRKTIVPHENYISRRNDPKAPTDNLDILGEEYD